MQTLFIDLASNAQLLAVTDDKRTLASRTSDKRFDEQELMPLIESMLTDAGSSLRDLKRIACVTGPGGFMSLRVGAALANALAYSLKIPAAGIHLSDVWSARAGSDERVAGSTETTRYLLPAHRLIWLHSTKRTHLFIRGFGDHADKYPEPILIDAKDLSSLPKDTPIVGELIEEHQALTTHCKRITDVSPVDAILPARLGTLEYSSKQIEPWYGRGA